MGKAAELEKFEKEFIDRKPNRCSKCKGRLKYLGGGYYQCFDCENTEIDDFGRIKDYIDENSCADAFATLTDGKEEWLEQLEMFEDGTYYSQFDD